MGEPMIGKAEIFPILLSICLVTSPLFVATTAGAPGSDAGVRHSVGPHEEVHRFDGRSVDSALDSTFCEPESAVQQEAVNVATGNAELYETRANKIFTWSFWVDVSQEDIETAVESLQPDYTDIAIETLIKASGATAAGPATALMDVVTVGVQTLLSLQHSSMANILSNANTDPIQRNLRDLAENSRDLRNNNDVTNDGEFTCADKKKLFTQRRSLLKETYGSLNSFEAETYLLRHRSMGPTENERLRNQAYAQIRDDIARLRTVLLIDYHATMGWLKNRPSNENLAEELKTQFSDRGLEKIITPAYSYISISTLDSKTDYTLYRIEIPEK